MKAQSSVYIKLQNIYKEKARQDVLQVLNAVRAVPGGEDVDPDAVELFCKNARFIKLINSSVENAVNLSQVVGESTPSRLSEAL